MSGKLADMCRSFWINVDAECIIVLDLQAPIGFTLESNGKHNIIGIPFESFTITCTVATRIKFIAGIYPFPIDIVSLEHYENVTPINYVQNAPGVNETIVTFPAPVTSWYIIIGVAPVRIAFDRVATLLDPLVPVGVFSLPLKVNNTIQGISVGGLTTYNGWGLY